MNRFLSIVAAVALTGVLGLGTDLRATAKPGAGGKSSASKSAGKSAQHSNNHQLATTHQGKTSSVRFHVRGYRGWRSYCWFPTYGCYGFYDSTCQGWFYWYEPSDQFLPIDTIDTLPPGTSGADLLPPGAVPVEAAPYSSPK
jgi:hypothetical protein